MRHALFLFGIAFFSCSSATQPFEPLFLTGGVPPVVYHSAYPSVRVLQSAEHFIRFITNEKAHALVCFDENDSTMLEKAVSVAAHWPNPLDVFLVNTATHSFLVRALARTIGLTQVAPGSVLVCADGAAVLPLIASCDDEQDMRRAVLDRFADAAISQQTFDHSSLSVWWQHGVELVTRLWDKISGYLFV